MQISGFRHTVEHVELGDGEAVKTLRPAYGIATPSNQPQRRQAAGRRAEFLADLAQPRAGFVVHQFRGEQSRADRGTQYALTTPMARSMAP